jgi:rhodanese-related sulfurtransferase
MTSEIAVDTLRQWLDEHRQIAVLDVRTREDRAQWWIPNSTHVDAYEALRTGEPGPLATLALPAHQPVVTVCGAGRLSRTAAEILSARGLDVSSLIGGMKAWSVAWNTADVTMPDAPAPVVQVRRTGKGCLSYIVGSDDEAAVIDAALAPHVYLTLARDRGWRIRYVLDTHIHADHLSRSRRLAEDAGATLMLARATASTIPLFRSRRRRSDPGGHVGARCPADAGSHAREHVVRAETPTRCSPETHCSRMGSADPTCTQTRPAHARGRASCITHSRASALFHRPRSCCLVTRANPFPSTDGAIAATLRDIDVWLSTWLVSEEAFIDRLVSRLPPTPPNFARIVALNELGELPDDDATELEAGANRCSVA